VSGWWVLAGWLLGVVLTWRTFAVGIVLASIWPLALPIRTAFRTLNRRGALRTDTEKAAAEKAELTALRRLAREHGLPMPGGES
jgi:hypothetical protein